MVVSLDVMIYSAESAHSKVSKTFQVPEKSKRKEKKKKSRNVNADEK